MSLCKHPEEVCCSMTLYHGRVYCDNANGFCHLHDEPPPMTNADHIRSMTDEELAVFLEDLYSHCNGPWEILFERKFCDHCHAPEYELEDGRKLKIHECDFTGGKCPHGSDVLWWLQQPYKEDK